MNAVACDIHAGVIFYVVLLARITREKIGCFWIPNVFDGSSSAAHFHINSKLFRPLYLTIVKMRRENKQAHKH